MTMLFTVMPSLLSLLLPPLCRVRLRAAGDAYRVTVSTRSSDHDDASATLASTDFISQHEALLAVHALILDRFLTGVGPRDQRFSDATAAYHRGHPGVRPRSEAARLRLRTCADDLVEFCHEHARAVLALRRLAAAQVITLPEVPSHPLLAHALDDMAEEHSRQTVEDPPATTLHA